MSKRMQRVLIGVIAAVAAAATGSGQAQPRVSDEQVFLVESYAGKCLDYGPPSHRPPGWPTGPDPAVYLNDCSRAHPIRVEEINPRHDVVLHAGTKILGVTKPPLTDRASGSVPQELALELQDPGDPVGSRTDHVFALDGDSIILPSSRPCFNTDKGGMLVEGWVELPSGPAGPTPCPAPPPELVVQVQNGRGANGSPIVVGLRNLVEAEFWNFTSAGDQRQAGQRAFVRLTSAFTRVATAEELWNAICYTAYAGRDSICTNTPMSGWGRVIYIQPPDANGIDLSAYPALYLPPGITIRSDRRGINMGAQLSAVAKKSRNSERRCAACMFEVHGDYVRITGLRLKGNSRDTRHVEEATIGVQVDYPGWNSDPIGDHASLNDYIATIDRNDISDWEEGAVVVENGWRDDYDCVARNDPETLANVRIERNFLHHNERWSGGYGVSVGRAVIVGNTFLMNRHAIAAGGEAHNEYRAWYNLLLSYVPTYHCFWWECSRFDPDWYKHGSDWFGGMGAQQDFDMHGTGDGGYGGNGGYRVDIAANTFLGTDRPNFELRGHPCAAAYFRSNVSEKNGGDAIHLHNIGDPAVPVIAAGPEIPSSPVNVVPTVLNADYQAVKLFKSHNQFRDSSPTAYSHPMWRVALASGNQADVVDPANSLLRVGDFDGDGIADLFVATGNAWYYSAGGQTEWRFLRARTETVGRLLFGDFDADGRTDVFTQIGDDWMVSWAGVSEWEAINRSHWRMTDFYVGDFVGDSRADVFFSRGDQWFVSDAGRGGFLPYAASGFHVVDLAFGHFDREHGYGNDEKLDVVGVVNNQWMVVYAQDPERQWRALHPGAAPTNTMTGLIVADFSGTGYSDIVAVTAVQDSQHRHVAGAQWKVSRFGRSEWQDLTYIPATTAFAAVGRFDEKKRNTGKGTDILIWDGRLGINMILSGTGVPRRHSRQDMS